MVFVKINEEDWNSIQNMISDDDLYVDGESNRFGREQEPHITILDGIYNDADDYEIEHDSKNIEKPEIKNKGISYFEEQNYDVLIFDIESDDLEKLNDYFKRYPHKKGHPVYHPHVTIAYVKKDRTQGILEKLRYLNNIEIEPEKIVYAEANGSRMNYNFK